MKQFRKVAVREKIRKGKVKMARQKKEAKVRLSKKQLENLLSTGEANEQEIVLGSGDDSVTIKVRKKIAFAEKMSMSRDIVLLTSPQNGGVEGYIPMFYDLSVNVAILSYYTNLLLPQDINELYMLVKETDLMEKVMSIVGPDVKDVLDSTKETVANKINYLIHRSDGDNLMEKLLGVADSFKGKIEETDVEELLSTFKNLGSMSTDKIVDVILKTKKEKDLPTS